MIKVWADSVLGEDLSPGLQTTTFLLYPHMVWRERETEMERERETEMERERERDRDGERETECFGVSSPSNEGTNSIMGSPPS